MRTPHSPLSSLTTYRYHNKPVKANGKRVVGPDAEATNGFLHGINGTLRVPYLDLKSLYHSKPDLSALGYVTLLLDQQKVNTSLQEPSTTLLAFGVKAFENLYKQDPVLYSYLIQSYREEAQEDLRSIVQCHILPNNLLYSDDIKEGSQLLRNALGEEVNITKVQVHSFSFYRIMFNQVNGLSDAGHRHFR